MDFQHLLKFLRGSRSLRDLERLSGISNAYLSQLENGRANTPNVDIVRKLQRVYPLHKKDILLSLDLL